MVDYYVIDCNAEIRFGRYGRSLDRPYKGRLIVYSKKKNIFYDLDKARDVNRIGVVSGPLLLVGVLLPFAAPMMHESGIIDLAKVLGFVSDISLWCILLLGALISVVLPAVLIVCHQKRIARVVETAPVLQHTEVFTLKFLEGQIRFLQNYLMVAPAPLLLFAVYPLAAAYKGIIAWAHGLVLAWVSALCCICMLMGTGGLRIGLLKWLKEERKKYFAHSETDEQPTEKENSKSTSKFDS